MATKKRKVIPQVEAHRERRRRLSAGLAQRQSAALGKAAREQLQSLVETGAPAPRVELKLDLSGFAEAGKRMQQALLKSSWLSSFPPFQTGSWPPPTISFDIGPVTPTIDASKLEALKNAEAYRVQPQVPDMVQVITGWRGWSISGGMRLAALGQSGEWPCKEPMRATCAKELTHVAPDWDCTCGIWAFKDVDRLVAAIGGGYRGVRVIGSVSLWGKVIETENGYRAQYAYPLELWLLDESLEQLGLAYDVPVRKAG